MNVGQKLATELNIKSQQVDAVIALLDGGATVPFISRYRKEATGGLTDTELRLFEERLGYLRELQDRRETILKSINEQGKLTPELEKEILATDSKSTLEDLYLPYKPKRRTKAQIAREAGLEPLAHTLLTDPTQFPEKLALSYLNAEHNITNIKEALEGAGQILMEQFSEHAALLGSLRQYSWDHGILKSIMAKGKETEGNKFSDYFTYEEPIKKIPSHRALALFRGQREEILYVNLSLTDDQVEHCLTEMQQTFNVVNKNRPADQWLIDIINNTWKIRIAFKIELELLMQLRQAADEEAIHVFSNNLKHLLMAAPAGSHVTLALDPGLRTGVKAVVIDSTGKLLANTTIFPHVPRNDWDGSLHELHKLCVAHKVSLVSIGNGTASRETDKLIIELKKKYPDLQLTSIVVSEAGASVYSASELAAKEFPSLDVTYRGAVSIGRRLQDPLAELIKIDPKSIGVGQYQHDVNQTRLSRALRAVMEDCVNAVGVDINTASAPLLACIAGLNETVASNIVTYREQHGAFKNRSQLKKIPRLGDKAFEQSAGFLRISNGDNPLDASAVHPEAYAVVERILAKQQKEMKDIVGNAAVIRTLRPADYTDEKFGLPTVTDILHELEKPGRDPRPEFKTAVFKEGIETLKDLTTGMILEGVVTNVANFGAFVDIGVHQDGLVHISMLADKFIKDPNEVVKVGDIVKVKILEVDLIRKRIQLSMRLNDTPVAASTGTRNQPQPSNKPAKVQQPKSQLDTSMGSALLMALGKNK
jgi:uncharacterized protein